MTQSLTQALADFVVTLKTPINIPDDIAEKAKVTLLNGYGIALACFPTSYWSVASDAALAIDGERQDGATLLADGRKTSFLGAVLANSALFHGRAQEDACGAAHLGAILIPLLTAALETGRMPASRLLPALIAGYEVGGILEANYASYTTPIGLRASPLYGAPAAAAAAAIALDLNSAQTAAALANAASFTGGLLQSFSDGTDEWRYQLGIAAQNGWIAAELAKAGSVSAPYAIEGKNGFIRAYARTDCDVRKLMNQIGKVWFIHKVVFKPYPVCAFNQTPVNAALKLSAQLQGRLPAKIQVYMNPYETGYAGMDSTGPFHSVSGTLMSIPFCIASTLLYGVPTINRMMAFDDEQVHALINRIELIPDKTVETLNCRLRAEFDDTTEPLIEYLQLSTEDYNFKRADLRALIIRVCAEVDIGPDACIQIERFVDDPTTINLNIVLEQFSHLRRQFKI